MVILCVATYFKGDAFIRECRRQGCTVIPIAADALAGAAWPQEAIDEIHTRAASTGTSSRPRPHRTGPSE